MANTREMILVLNGKLGPGMKSSTSQVTRQLQAVNDQIKRIGQKQSELKKFENQLKKSGQATHMLGTEFSRLQTDMLQAERQAERLRKRLAFLDGIEKRTQMARTKLFDAAAWSLALAAPVKKAMDFESAMADVRKTVDGMSDPRNLREMSKAILDLSTNRRIPMTADALAKIVAAGGQAGIARKDLIAFASDAAKMGIAFDTTAEEAGEQMAKWRTSFRMTQPEVVTLADKVNYLSDKTAASASAISEIVTRIGPLGEVGGLASGEIAALGASMASMGIDPERAATGIKKLIVTLTSGSAATKQQRVALKALRMDAVQLSRAMQKDAGGTLIKVFEALRKLPKSQQVSIMKQLFGEEGLAAVSSLLPALGQVRRNLDMVSKSTRYAGSMQREFENRSKTTANQLQLMQNRVVRMAIKLGSVLLPEINKIIAKLSPMVDGIVRWTDKNPKLFSTIVKVTSALVALRIAMLAGNYARLVVMGGVVELGAHLWNFLKVIHAVTLGYRGKTLAEGASLAMTRAYTVGTKAAAAAQWLWNAALSANPIGLVVAAVAALVAELWLLKRAYDEMKSAQEQLEESNKQTEVSTAAEAASAKKHSGLRKQQATYQKLVRSGKIDTRTMSFTKWQAAHPLPKRAFGGPVAGGGSYLVGERGPEVFTPRRSGAIVPNLALAGAGMSVSVPMTINVYGNASRSDLQAAFGNAKHDLKRMLQDLMRDEQRRVMA